MLYYYSDLWDVCGLDPLFGYVADRVDDEKMRISHEVFLGAVAALQRERWHLYVRLRPLYFDEDPNPERLNEWKREAGEAGGNPQQSRALDSVHTKLAHHEEAVAFMLERVEKGLRARGLARLYTSLPVRIRGERRRRIERRRRRSEEILCQELESAPRPEAIKRAHQRVAAEGEPYSLKEMRVMARDIEGRASRREREEIRRESG